MIDTDIFRKQIAEKHTYLTPEKVERSLWYRMFGGLDIVYKSAVAGVIVNGGSMARKGKWNRDSWLNLSLDIWRGVENCGGRFDVSGCENLAGINGPSVIISNHMSLLETFAIPAIVLPFQNMTFVVKESLTKLPLFKDVMMGVRPISLGRKNPREDLKQFMTEGAKVLEDGRSIVVFPQSTRSVTFNPSQFNSIGSKLAKRMGVPLVPLALKTDFHGMGRVVKDFGPVDRSKTVYFKFGPAQTISGNGRDEQAACSGFIGRTLQGWGGSVEQES